MKIYELTHICFEYKGESVLNELELGFYSDIDTALSAKSYYLSLPGFGENEHGFLIKPRVVNGNVSNDEIFNAYLYIHTQDLEFEYVVPAGLFSCEDDADAAVQEIFNCNSFDGGKFEVEMIIERCILNEMPGDFYDGFKIYTYDRKYPEGADIIPVWVDEDE